MKKAGTFAALLLVLAAGPGLAGCFQNPPADETVTAQVRKQVAQIVKAYNAQNAAAAAAYDAPDYVGIHPGEPNTIGPAADEAGMKAQMAAGKVHWQIGNAKVTVSREGDLAVFEAPYTYTVTFADRRTQRESGNWIAIFKRQEDGTEVLWRSIASATPPANAAGA